MCLSHLIYTVRPCLIHTYHPAPMPCSNHVVLLKATANHGHLSKAVLCRDLEKNGVVRAWHGRGMASVNQTRPHCINQMGKTHSKPLGARHGRGTAWAWHVMCVNRPVVGSSGLIFKGRNVNSTLESETTTLSRDSVHQSHRRAAVHPRKTKASIQPPPPKKFKQI